MQLITKEEKFTANNPGVSVIRPVISLKGIELRRENKIILHDIDLTVTRGEFVAVTGPNGGGKTTLLRIILKLISPNKGSVKYFTPDGKEAKRLNIGYLPQKNMIDSHFPISVREVISSGLLTSRHMSAQEKEQRITECMEQCGLESLGDRAIGNLSGGQLQRTLFARAIVSSPDILILDEPLSYIDKHFEPKLYEIVERMHCNGATVILVSHEMSHIASMATRHLVVDRTIHVCHAKVHYTPSDCE